MIHQLRNISTVLLASLLALPGPVPAQKSAPSPKSTPAQKPAPAQEQNDETFYDSVEVNVVNVEVFVTDRGGQRVKGLTQSDFEVLEDGQPVEITNFYASEGAPAAPAAA